MYGQIDCDYNQFMWILLPEAFFTRQYGNSETDPLVRFQFGAPWAEILALENLVCEVIENPQSQTSL